MSAFNHPRVWDTDPGPGPLPPRWPSLEDINLTRASHGLAGIPSSEALTQVLRAQGFTACEGSLYQRADRVFATSEAEVLVA